MIWLKKEMYSFKIDQRLLKIKKDSQQMHFSHVVYRKTILEKLKQDDRVDIIEEKLEKIEERL